MTYFETRKTRLDAGGADVSETLEFIYDRIQDRHGLTYEAKFAKSDVHDARAIAKLAVSRMRQVVRRGRDTRACLLHVIAELEHLTTHLTGAKL